MPRIDLVQVRRDTAANWTSVNPTLSSGECGFETDTRRLKIGDGSAAWTSLAYITRAVVSKSANYTLQISEAGALCDASGGAFAITLPTAASAKDVEFFVKKTDSSVYAVTIDGDGSETIDESTTQVISSQYDCITVYSDGTEWWII